MLSRRFERLFRELTTAYVTYDDVPRTPDRVPERARARAALDRVRDEIARERAVIEQWDRIVERLRATDSSAAA